MLFLFRIIISSFDRRASVCFSFQPFLSEVMKTRWLVCSGCHWWSEPSVSLSTARHSLVGTNGFYAYIKRKLKSRGIIGLEIMGIPRVGDEDIRMSILFPRCLENDHPRPLRERRLIVPVAACNRTNQIGCRVKIPFEMQQTLRRTNATAATVPHSFSSSFSSFSVSSSYE